MVRPKLVRTHKFCPHCKTEKLLAEFYKRATGKISAYCRVCSRKTRREHRLAFPEKHAARARSWRRRNQGRNADYFLKSIYGMPLGGYDAMLVKQDGKCAICQTDKPGGKGRFHVDHCHGTKEVRGLLCHRCNTGIGLLGTVESLQSAISYLNKFSPANSLITNRKTP